MAVLAIDQNDLGKAVRDLIRTLMSVPSTGASAQDTARVDGMVQQVASAMRTTRMAEGLTAEVGTLTVGDHQISGDELREAIYGLDGVVRSATGVHIQYLSENAAGVRLAVNGRRQTIPRELVETTMGRFQRTGLTEAEDTELRKAAEKMAKRIGKDGHEATIDKFHKSMRGIVTKSDESATDIQRLRGVMRQATAKMRDTKLTAEERAAARRELLVAKASWRVLLQQRGQSSEE